MVKQRRLPGLDYARGFFVVLMIVFHFCFVLADYGYVGFDFYRDPFWLHSRTFIVSGFLIIVGVSLVLANHNGFRPKPYFRRLALLVFYAALVSISTYIQVGERWVYFGILHFIAVASIVGLGVVHYQWLSLILGIIIIAMGVSLENAFFNPYRINWLGFMTHKPPTNDYVPLFPWLGVVFIGIFVGHWLLKRRDQSLLNSLLSWQSDSAPFKVLAFLGRHAIHVYIVHVPLFIGVIEVTNWVLAW